MGGFAAGEAEGGLEGEEGGGAGSADALGQVRVEIERGEGSGRGFAWMYEVGGWDQELVSRAGQAEDAAAGPAVVFAAGYGSEGGSATLAKDSFDIVDPSVGWWG